MTSDMAIVILVAALFVALIGIGVYIAFLITLQSALDANARLNFSGMGLDSGAVWISAPSLRPGGELGLYGGEDLAAGTVRTFLNTGEGSRTQVGWTDWRQP